MITDIILALVILAIVGGAIFYIIKEKKRGVRCIGCPVAGTCSHSGAASCSGCRGSCSNNCSDSPDTSSDIE